MLSYKISSTWSSLLGVRPQTPAPAILGDLGRYSLNVIFQCKSVKYWCKVWRKDPSSQVRQSYDLMVYFHNLGFKI